VVAHTDNFDLLISWNLLLNALKYHLMFLLSVLASSLQGLFSLKIFISEGTVDLT
jgi:hypothetical protein